MAENICLSVDILLIIFCILIFFTTWYMYHERKLYLYDRTYKKSDNVLTNISKIIKNPFIQNREILNKRDADVLYNNFSPPERRVPEYIYPTIIKSAINIPTRGIPENYQLVGLAVRNDTETVFNLFGRQTFPGSNQYEYYVESTNSNNNYKVPININGMKEIEDGQEIMINSTDKTKGKFKVNLYKYDQPRYNPYI